MRFDSHKNRCEAKNSIIVQDSYSQPKPPDEHNPRQSTMHTARLAHWINDGLGERECGHQQHERRGVGSEASLMAAWMLIRSCIFCIGHKVEIVSRATEDYSSRNAKTFPTLSRLTEILISFSVRDRVVSECRNSCSNSRVVVAASARWPVRDVFFSQHKNPMILRA